MKKFNIIYILWLGVFWICHHLFQNITAQNQYTFFGSAEAEGQTVNCEEPIVVQKILIKVGEKVHRGDTLAILMRSDWRELNRRSVVKMGEIEQFKTEKQAKAAEITQEIALLEAKKAGMLREVESQIQLLELENGVQADLKRLLSHPNHQQASNLRLERIKVLQNSVVQIDKQMNQQKVLLEAQIKANQVIFDSKIVLSEQERQWIESEKKQFVLIAPITGFIESLAMTLYEVIPARQTLVKINPLTPTRVRGFLNEAGNLQSSIGDTILLRSVARPEITTEGIFLSSSPQVVELPLRLRKYPEIKSWGREVFIQLPDGHRFYIGEKIIMQIKK